MPKIVREEDWKLIVSWACTSGYCKHKSEQILSKRFLSSFEDKTGKREARKNARLRKRELWPPYLACSTFRLKERNKPIHSVGCNQHKCKHTWRVQNGDEDNSNWIIIQPDKPTNCSFSFSQPTKGLQLKLQKSFSSIHSRRRLYCKHTFKMERTWGNN